MIKGHSTFLIAPQCCIAISAGSNYAGGRITPPSMNNYVTNIYFLRIEERISSKRGKCCYWIPTLIQKGLEG